MFLTELNERERKNFLELASYTMKVDGNISLEEQDIFQNFRAETRLSEEAYKIVEKDPLLIIRDFNASRKKIKKIVVFELLGIIMADEIYSQKEEEIISKLIQEWNLREFEVKKAKRWVEDFRDMIAEAYSFIEN